MSVLTGAQMEVVVDARLGARLRDLHGPGATEGLGPSEGSNTP